MSICQYRETKSAANGSTGYNHTDSNPKSSYSSYYENNFYKVIIHIFEMRLSLYEYSLYYVQYFILLTFSYIYYYYCVRIIRKIMGNLNLVGISVMMTMTKRKCSVFQKIKRLSHYFSLIFMYFTLIVS